MTDRTKLILNARRRGSCYGNGKPQWLEGRARKPCKTASQAVQQRKAAVKLLRRHGKENERALDLARRVDGCRKSSRCLSGACPVCQRAYQRLFVMAAKRLLTGEQAYSVVSAIPKSSVGEGDLT
jgi:hypothetical protein